MPFRRLSSTSNFLIRIGLLGAWLVETYKGTFASEISKGGMDGLIKALTCGAIFLGARALCRDRARARLLLIDRKVGALEHRSAPPAAARMTRPEQTTTSSVTSTRCGADGDDSMRSIANGGIASGGGTGSTVPVVVTAAAMKPRGVAFTLRKLPPKRTAAPETNGTACRTEALLTACRVAKLSEQSKTTSAALISLSNASPDSRQ